LRGGWIDCSGGLGVEIPLAASACVAIRPMPVPVGMLVLCSSKNGQRLTSSGDQTDMIFHGKEVGYVELFGRSHRDIFATAYAVTWWMV
jgi:hypothetical protein